VVDVVTGLADRIVDAVVEHVDADREAVERSVDQGVDVDALATLLDGDGVMWADVKIDGVGVRVFPSGEVHVVEDGGER
jgi:enoyl reductase-like protein